MADDRPAISGETFGRVEAAEVQGVERPDREGSDSMTGEGAESITAAGAVTGPHLVDVFVLPAFLSEVECAELRAEMDEVPQVEGGVRETARPEADSIDRSGRSAFDCEVSETTIQSIAQRICRVAPQIAEHFDQALAEYETPHFVLYKPGDFYRAHRDLYADVVVPEPISRRRLSVVIFLNDGGDLPDEDDPAPAETMDRYGGGRLRLCSHDAHEFASRDAWDVPARQGLLVAFRADTWHEVTPVTVGGRYTIVALLLAPRSPAVGSMPTTEAEERHRRAFADTGDGAVDG
jgi:SM-20-related protein